MNRDPDLPEGWVTKPLGEAARLVKDKVDPTKVPNEFYVGLEHVEAGSMRLLGHGRGADVKSTKAAFRAGDVLYGKLRPYLNKVTRPPFDGICSTDFLVFGESDELDRSYLAQYLNQLSVANYAHYLSAGVELPRVDWKSLSTLPISFPASKSDQRAIVARIEKARALATRADGHLGNVRMAIDRFRRAVLVAACSGRLTDGWRSEHPGAAPTLPSEDLRHKRRGSGQQEPLDLLLPDLPESYALSTVGDAAIVLEYGTSKKGYSDPYGVPVLRMGNIQDGKLDISDLKFSESDAEIERLILKDGDLLFNRTNSPELVGKSAVFHGRERMSFASYLIRVRFAPNVADPDFVNLWINSAWGRIWARQVKTDGVSQSNINGTKLGAMPLPLPPLAEQIEIVARSAKILESADRLIERADWGGRTLDRAAQAVLAKAFRGDLTGVAV